MRVVAIKVTCQSISAHFELSSKPKRSQSSSVGETRSGGGKRRQKKRSDALPRAGCLFSCMCMLSRAQVMRALCWKGVYAAECSFFFAAHIIFHTPAMFVFHHLE
uniref:Uncharacterized protein n=1 Tax=Anopheles atroparvus TaxID=41427 RepID=A0AAG5DW38_ANOAO